MKRNTEAATVVHAERPDLTAWRQRHELRRSNAAQPIASKRQYRRTRKHRHRED
ncbi:hypothetical protein ACFVMC_29560 [Nocardia sp. NPDC127579]|uniref:hypothetical protein n=1 Tax=Nocardia sp. NPDC127579 TaxID=3345402 RepID=UPI00363F9E3F